MAGLIVIDQEIRRKVLEELRWDPAVDQTDIGVDVDARVVTLSGTVPSVAMKLAAERAARRVRGVAAVDNHILVRLPFDRHYSIKDLIGAHGRRWDSTTSSQRAHTVA